MILNARQNSATASSTKSPSLPASKKFRMPVREGPVADEISAESDLAKALQGISPQACRGVHVSGQ